MVGLALANLQKRLAAQNKDPSNSKSEPGESFRSTTAQLADGSVVGGTDNRDGLRAVYERVKIILGFRADDVQLFLKAHCCRPLRWRGKKNEIGPVKLQRSAWGDIKVS